MKYTSLEDEMVDENGQAVFELSPLSVVTEQLSLNQRKKILDDKRQSIQMARSERTITRRIVGAFSVKTTTIAEENKWILKNS